MAKPRKLEELLALLTQVRTEPTSEGAIAILQQVLKSKYSLAVARAAKIVGDAELYQLMPNLVDAFERFMINPEETDQGCLAKKEIAETLYRLEYSEDGIFLQGIHHVQMEPVWGGQEDTAAGLRGTCALGLVRANYPDVMVELADLLADPKPEARIAAARAIAYSESAQGVPLLRLRVRVGDEAQVLSECLMALLQLAPTQSIPLVKELLGAHEASFHFVKDTQTAEVAALALGESRLPDAFDILKDWWNRVIDQELRQTGLMAIAMIRHDQALEFLLSLIAEGNNRDAKGAIQALSIYREDNTLWQRVHQTTEQRGDVGLLQMVERGG